MARNTSPPLNSFSSNDGSTIGLLEDGESNTGPRLRRGRTASISARQKKAMGDHGQVSQKVSDNREKTLIKVDLQTRMLQATMRLATRSFEYAKTEPAMPLWDIPRFRCLKSEFMQQWFMQVPTLRDFRRAYNLVHDWYPKLHEEVRVHRETWEDCTRDVLSNMSELVEAGLISDDKDKKFKKWVKKMLAVHDKKEKLDKIQKANAALESMKELLDDDLFKCDDLRKLQGIRELLNALQVKSEQEVSEPSQVGNDEADTKEEQCENCCPFEDIRFDKVRQNLQAMYALICGPDAASYKANKYYLLEMKMPFLRVMWIILMLDFCLMYESLSLGMLAQIFLELNIDLDEEKESLKVFPLVFLPVFVLVYAILGSMLADLVHGSFQYPPFKIARARLIIALTPLLAGRNILFDGDLIRCPIRFIDLFLTDGLLILTIGGAIAFIFNNQWYGDDSFMDAVLDGLNAGAFIWTLIFGVAAGASRVYCNAWMEYQIEKTHKSEPMPSWVPKRFLASDLDKIVFRPTRASFILRDAFETYGILPGETWTYFLSLRRYIQIHKHDDAVWNVQQVSGWIKNEEDDSSTESWDQYSSKLADTDSLLEISNDIKGYGYLSSAALIWLVTGIFCMALDYYFDCQHKGWVLLSANVGMTLTAIFASFAAELLLPQLTAGNTFRLHGFFFIALIYCFSYVTTFFVLDMDTVTTMMTMSDDTILEKNGVFYNDGSNVSLATPYPVCQMSWGSPQAPVHVLDLAAMAYYSYAKNKTVFDDLLNKSFDSATCVHFDEYHTIPRIVAMRKCGDTTENCTTIMAVKGTSSKLEVMTDLGIFSTVSVLQMLDVVAPLLGTVPKTVIAYMIDFFRMPFMKNTQRGFIEKIEDVAKWLEGNYSNDTLLITGHSLGGNFAELVGAKKDIPAIGFSAPGQFYMMKTFEIGRQSIAENVVTIVPSMDPVPHVARHVDTVQRILCRRPDGRYRLFSECHSIEATSCELWRVCGDIGKRDFGRKCLDEPNENSSRTEPFVSEDCVGQVLRVDEEATCKMVYDR